VPITSRSGRATGERAGSMGDGSKRGARREVRESPGRRRPEPRAQSRIRPAIAPGRRSGRQCSCQPSHDGIARGRPGDRPSIPGQIGEPSRGAHGGTGRTTSRPRGTRAARRTGVVERSVTSAFLGLGRPPPTDVVVFILRNIPEDVNSLLRLLFIFVPRRGGSMGLFEVILDSRHRSRHDRATFPAVNFLAV
jgi:hypothetical protein